MKYGEFKKRIEEVHKKTKFPVDIDDLEITTYGNVYPVDIKSVDWFRDYGCFVIEFDWDIDDD